MTLIWEGNDNMSVHVYFLFLNIFRRHEVLSFINQSRLCLGHMSHHFGKVVLPGSWNHFSKSGEAPFLNNALCSGSVNLLPPADQFSAPRD